MRVIEVQFSSHISRISYDTEPFDNVIYVEFTDGSIYKYTDISYQRVTACVNAPSVGEYFHDHIRTSYPYERVV